MIHIDYNSTKDLTFYLQPSLSTPVYLLSLVNYTTRERTNFIAPDVSGLAPFLQLTVTEVGTGMPNLYTGNVSISPPGLYTIEVYEQAGSTNLDETLSTYLGEDEFYMHQDPTYDNPTLRNAIPSVAAADYNNDYNNDYLI